MNNYNRRDFLKASSLLTGGLLFGDSLYGKALSATDPFIASIKIVSFNFAPKGWALCNGQLLLISQNQALFALLGTTYGGDGQTTFALPDFRGRVPIHMGRSSVGGYHSLGERSGEIDHTITTSELPTHTHLFSKDRAPEISMNVGNGLGTTDVPGNHFGMNPAFPHRFHDQYDDQNINTNYVSPSLSTGGSQAHNNMMPYLTLNFIIALQGVFPSQT
jgi:microcystin-dependent protein